MKQSSLVAGSVVIVALSITAAVVISDLDSSSEPVQRTAKALSQVDARVPLQRMPGTEQANINITLSGSYYLTDDLLVHHGKTGIMIGASDVTIDLNGFSLIGNGGDPGTSGIRAKVDSHNISVRNGTVRDFPGAGVIMENATRCQVLDVRVDNNGGRGVHVAADGIVRDCVVTGNGFVGIWAGTGSVVDDCIVARNADAGLVVDSHCAVTGCFIRDNGGNGINLFGVQNDVSRNRCLGNGGFGIAVNSDASGVIRDNFVIDNTSDGVRTFSPGSIILRNVATGNGGDNYAIGPGNDVGSPGPAAKATSPWANVDS